jgi:hypothetical protein
MMKVAQYKVLGNEAKDKSVPAGRKKHSASGSARGSAIACICRSSRQRPGRILFKKALTEHFVLGYFRQVPAPKDFRGLRD